MTANTVQDGTTLTCSNRCGTKGVEQHSDSTGARHGLTDVEPMGKGRIETWGKTWSDRRGTNGKGQNRDMGQDMFQQMWNQWERAV